MVRQNMSKSKKSNHNKIKQRQKTADSEDIEIVR